MKRPASLFLWLRFVLLALQLQSVISGHGAALFGFREPFFISVPGLEGLSESSLVLPLGWLSILCTILLAFGFYPRFTQPISAMSAILFQLLTFNGRQAFAFLPPLMLLALSVRDGERHEKPVAPVLLLASIYLTASLQKLTHWSAMQGWLPRLLTTRISDPLRALLGPEAVEFVVRGMSFVVIPVEFAMGSLLLFDRTRKFGFVLAVLFHTSLALGENGRDTLVWVGFLMLTAHAVIATDLARLQVRELDSHRIFKIFLITSAICGAVAVILSLSTRDFFELRRILKTVAMLTPPIAISAVAYFARTSRPLEVFSKSTWSLSHGHSGPLILFSALLITWSFGADLTDRKTEHLGWSMFSGASWSDPRPLVAFDVANDACTRPLTSGGNPNVRFMIWYNPFPEHFTVRSRFENGLQKLRLYIQQHCPNSKMSETRLEAWR